MLERSVLEGLLARVREAKGPDRELDAEIWWAFADHSETDGDIQANAEELGAMAVLDRWCGPLWRRTNEMVPFLTDSMDAAHTLFRRELPSTVRLGLVEEPNQTWQSVALRVEPDDAKCEMARGVATAPLAILTALLLALSQDETREEH